MKEVKLKPEQIIVPGDKLEYTSILQIYFRVFNEGHADCLPPILLTNKNKINSSYLGDSFSDKKKADNFYQRLMNHKASYILFDGNHKSVASVLCQHSIYSLELERDEDLMEVRKMVESGKLFGFPYEEDSLEEIANRFIGFVYARSLYEPNEIVTVKERVNELVANQDIPQYMIDRYLQRSTS